jgi:hypothetical protein
VFAQQGFCLPYIGDRKENQLLWAFFDLTRHGLAHLYQQILNKLTDGKNFFRTLTSAEFGQVLNGTTRPTDYLAYYVDRDGYLGVTVYHNFLFLDFEDAINQSNLLDRNLTINRLSRPIQKKQKLRHKMKKQKYYDFNIESLKKSLDENGHRHVQT